MAAEPEPIAIEPLMVAEPSVAMSSYLPLSSFMSEPIDTMATTSLPTVDDLWSAIEKSPKTAPATPKREEPITKHQERLEIARPILEPQPVSQPTFKLSLPPTPPPAPAATKVFKPAWQVDHFSWPKLCQRLIERAADELDRLTDAIEAIGRQGNKVLAMGSCRNGEGATTLLLSAARRLSERGVKSVVIDANLERPRVAKRLGVQSQIGWDETIDQPGRTLDQAIVEATAQNIAIVPVRETPAECGREPGDPSRLSACLQELHDHYDMVLIDVGSLENGGIFNLPWGRAAAEWIPAIIIVQNPNVTSDDIQQSVEGKLAVAGVAVAGIVENFVAED
jgi:Mrp family chromosome partitioning ATPase